MATGYEKIIKAKNKLKHEMTVDELAEAMECGPRTAYRFLSDIAEENCGLHSIRKNGKTYYVIQSEKQVDFNQNIVEQLEKVKKTLSPKDASDLKSIKLLDKVVKALQTTDPSEFKPEAITLDPNLVLDDGPFSDDKLQDSSVNRVLQAIRDGFKIKISYQPSDKPKYTKEVSPVKIIKRVDTLYLVAADETFEETQIFKNYLFENISSVVVTGNSMPKLNCDETKHYKYAFGKFTNNEKPENVTLEIPSTAKWIHTLFERSHFNPPAKKRIDKQGNMIVDLEIRRTPDFENWLAGTAEEIKIIKPESLKNVIREKLKKGLKNNA